MTDALKPRFDGPWIIAACFITFGIASGFPYYNIAFFYDYMRDDHGWSPQILTFGPPLAVMLTIWAGPLIVPRVSPRKLIVFGTGMIFLAFQFVLEEQGFHDQAARNAIWSTASSMSLMAAIAGRLVVGDLADRWPRKHLMIATYVLVAVAIPLLFLVTPEQPQFGYVFAVVFGFAMGADYMLIPLMAADLFGLPSLARAMAAILPSDTVTQYWCPNLIAALAAAWAGYGSALWVACAIAAIGAAAVSLLQPPESGVMVAATPIAAVPKR